MSEAGGEHREGGMPGGAPMDGPGDPDAPARWLHGIVLLGLFGAVAVAVRPVLSPFVLYAVFLYLIWPRLASPLYARLAAAATGLTGLWLLEVTGLLLAPFILAFLLAYVLDPVVDALQAYVPRPAAISFLALPLAGAVALVAFVLAPAAGHQVSELIADVPSYVESVRGWIDGVRSWVIGLGIEGINQETVPRFDEIDAQAVVGYLQERQAELTRGGLSTVLGIGRGLGTVLTVAAYLVLLPILTYFLLRDWDRILEQIAELVPPAHRRTVSEFAGEYDRLLNRYLRGQVLLAACVGLIVGVGFWVVGFPYPLLLGLVAGVFNIVPYLGFAVSLVLAVAIALFSGSVLVSLGKVALVFGFQQVGENVLGPLIIGESVGLHPVWMLLAISLFGFFFGFVGLLVAVPVAVLVKLMLSSALRRYRSSAWYREGVVPGTGEPGSGTEGTP